MKKSNKFWTSSMLTTMPTFLSMCTYATTTSGTVVTGSGIGPELGKTLGEIISVLFWIACFACTLKIIHIGILYLTTGVEGKSKAKGALLPWLIGAFICVTFATLGPAIMNLFYTGGNVLDY